MPRSSAVSIENNFSRGLITEATAMNYPENSVVETQNCIFEKNGKVIRRYGIDFENEYAVTSFESLGVMGTALAPEDYFEDLAFAEFEWTTVSGDGNIAFLVSQIGNILSFYEINDDNQISANRKSYTIDLTDYQVEQLENDEGQYVAELECGFSSGFGYMFVTHPLCHPFYVQYNDDTDSITDVFIDIKIRDFERLNDSLAIDTRPSSLTDLHKYNLYNQGWYISAKNATPATSNVITYWDGARTDFPSNADIWWLYKNSSELLDSTLIDTTALGNTPAPNGHYTYSAWFIDRNTTLGVTGLPSVDSNNYRPSCTAFYAGRVWYAGVNAQGYTSKIYFSKIVEGVGDFGICYQVNDPTSENLSDLLETDGGVINIPDIAKILRIVPVGFSLYVFASNGTWKISGSDKFFAASDYSVTKISSASIAASNSVVVAEGTPFWWDRAGIYSISVDPTTGQEQVNNVTEQTIQSLINSIPDDNLPYVKGAYNNINKTIHWVYNTTASTTVSAHYTYNSLLVLNLLGQSFSPQEIPDNVPKVCGVVFTTKSNKDPLVNNRSASIVKFLTAGSFGIDERHAFTISQYNNGSYLDWVTYNGAGADFSSYFITGYRIRGELLRKFQSNYVLVVTEQEEDAGCLIQGVWDYSNDPVYGRFTTSQQVFKSDTLRDYSRRKLKIRGNGYSLQFKFYSQLGKPFTLIGWSVSESANNVP
ncbi:MAG: hypothetical protein EKK63_10040 [Acinetobacter sp.]|uniref:hypothetical protein n=1 Tax=Acinetobacter sp. TaxID=472 RepID=UPI000F997711|nr:hypothetical protein [Acinetobacter sp.]RUP39330.1 MAG: hypothetical protein EKK63_10040 [Acinetobacter sp.]